MRSTISARIRIAVAAFGMLSSPAITAPGPAPHSIAVGCDGARRAGALQLAPDDAVAAGRSLRFLTDKPDVLTVLASRRATGACAPALKAVVNDNLLLSDGHVVSSDAGGMVTPRPTISYASNIIAADAPHPQGGDGVFEMGFRVGYRRIAGNLITDYVGLWRVRDGSAIRYFSTAPSSGGFTTPKPLLSSSEPLRGVTYFPAPDTPSGTIGLVQGAGAATRVITLRWRHAGAFS